MSRKIDAILIRMRASQKDVRYSDLSRIKAKSYQVRQVLKAIDKLEGRNVPEN